MFSGEAQFRYESTHRVQLQSPTDRTPAALEQLDGAALLMPFSQDNFPSNGYFPPSLG
jgi:hypothetical protein